MLEIVAYLRDYTDHCHHPREDAAFERLALRCPDLKLDLAPDAALRSRGQIVLPRAAQLLSPGD